MTKIWLKSSKPFLYSCALVWTLSYGLGWSSEEEEFFKPCVFPGESLNLSESSEKITAEFFKDHHYEMDTQAEAVLKRLKQGKDGRELVKNSEEFPYKAQVHFKTTFWTGKGEIGSGTFIDERVILTAAHVVYSPTKGGIYKSLEAFIDSKRLRSAGKVEGVKIAKEYVENPEKNWESDYALVFIDRPTGKETGHLGLGTLRSEEMNKIPVTITGYPLDKIDKNSGVVSMWGMSGKLEQITPHSLHYNIDTFAGQSGSAIWYKSAEKGYIIVGVHAYGPDKNYMYNRGSRLIKPMSTTLIQWLKDFTDWSSNLNSTKNDFFDNKKLKFIVNTVLANKESGGAESARELSEELEDEGIPADFVTRAKAGEGEAQYEIGLKYTKGEDVFKDENRAFYWFNQSFKTYKPAAFSGNAEAQYKIALLYNWGRGIEKDQKQSLFWWQKAAEQGHPKAQYNLGALYEKVGPLKNIKLSFEWYEKAALNGIREAEYELGNFYKQGIKGVIDQDKVKARYWYQKAADQRMEEALKKLEKLDVK